MFLRMIGEYRPRLFKPFGSAEEKKLCYFEMEYKLVELGFNAT